MRKGQSFAVSVVGRAEGLVRTYLDIVVRKGWV
jgi:hypothetical protein